MRSNIGPALILLVACGGSGETSNAGPIGQATDLRSRITKPEVAARAPKDDAATKQEFPVDIHGVKAKLAWRTFEDSGTKYILSFHWEVVTPSKGITLESLGPMNPVNAGTEAAPVQAELVRVRWHDNNSSGTKYGDMTIKIDAAGTAQVY
jgi:hypothetical protein